MNKEETSSWVASKNEKTFPKLTENLTADVVILGGGLAGISIAYKLAQTGKKVVVLEKGRIGQGVTAYTTAFITQNIDTDLTDLVKMYGEDESKKIWEAGGAAIDWLETIIKKEKIDCDFQRCSAYTYTMKEDGFAWLQEEFEIGQKLGRNLVLHKNNPFAFKNYGSLETKNQAKFHPLKYISKLSSITESLGCQIFEQSEAIGFKQVDEQWEIETKDGNKVTAKSMVLTTYYPFTNPKQTLFKKGMYVSYVYELQIPKGIIPENIYWDDDNPYNYFRIDAGENFDLMIVGGQDHRKEIPIDPEKNYHALREYVESILPGVEYKITKKWSGPILEPSDGLALIGETYENQYVATAFSGNGMTYSQIAAMIIADLINKEANPYSDIYDPKRMPSLKQLFIKGEDYVGELFGGALQNLFKSAD